MDWKNKNYIFYLVGIGVNFILLFYLLFKLFYKVVINR